MAIQAQFYHNNAVGGSFGSNNNGYCVDDLVEYSCFNSQQQKLNLQQVQLEDCLQVLYNESQSPVDPNLPLVYDPKLNNVHHAMFDSPNFDGQLEMQVDQYVRLQNAKLRLMIEEQGKQQVATLLKRVESHSLSMLREKDQEIAQAAKRRVELEDYLRRLEAENQAWQRMAQENESVALSLHKTLEDMRERASNCNNLVAASDAESCCDEWMGEEDGIGENMFCRRCNSSKMCCLFLPCRHLSLCKDCGALLKACPVCRTPKKATIETLIF